MKPNRALIHTLNEAIASFNEALNEEVEKVIISGDYKDMVDNSPSDIAARYWLQEFLSVLNRKEIQSIVDGFLVQMLNEEQAKKLVKFLLVRFPAYYAGDVSRPVEMVQETPLPGVSEKPASNESAGDGPDTI